MNKIFLFDIGNVIFKTNDYKELYTRLNCTCSLEEFIEHFRYSEYYENCEKGLISTYDYIDALKKDIGSEVSYDEYIQIHYATKGEIYKDTINLMNSLKDKGYKVGILSNLKKTDVDHFKTIYDTRKLDYEFYSCYLNDMKPSINLFNHVAKITKTDKNEVYFFDDLEENCEGARKCGIRAIQTFGYNILENFNKYVNMKGSLFDEE